MSNYVVYVQLLGVIILGSVIGEYYRIKKGNLDLTASQFLANFLMSVFASFMIILYLFDNLETMLRRIAVSGFVSIQDYNLINKLVKKIINLELKSKEGDD